MQTSVRRLPDPYDYRGFWTIIKKNPERAEREEILELIKILNQKGFSGGLLNFPFELDKHFNLEISGKIFLFPIELKDEKRKNFELEKKPSVMFSFFSSIFDSRWADMPVPPSILYLGSKTSKNLIKTDLSILNIEREIVEIPKSSIWGFTLFDDLLPEAIQYLDKIRDKYDGIIGAGGPFPTLSPIAAIVHIKSLNFLLRGEGEEVITELLYFVSNIRENTPSSVFFKSFKFSGLFYDDEKFFVLSGIDKINRLKTLDSIDIEPSIIPKNTFSKGLELNLSRGCPRSCVFCSHVHGKNFRMISKKKLEKILLSHKNFIKEKKVEKKSAFFININDDDILLGGEKVSEIMNVIKDNGYKIYGFQSSISSFIDKKGSIRKDVMDIVSDKTIYVDYPLLWLGTDAFTEERRKRLGKQRISESNFLKILELFEKRGIKNYHYWIILDGDSNWEEFFKEYFILWEIIKRFKEFELLPTSSYLIPYPYTPSYIKAIKKGDGRVVLRGILKSNFSDIYDYPLIKMEKPEDKALFQALNPETEYKTISFMKNRDFLSAFQNLYSYFKQSEFYLSLTDNERRKKIEWIELNVSKLID